MRYDKKIWTAGDAKAHCMTRGGTFEEATTGNNAETWNRYFSMKAQNDEAEVLIYEQIGSSFFEEGIGAKKFAEELKALGNIKNLTVRINSPGGSVFEGQAIYSQLKSHKAEKTVYIDGIAASIASVIAMAGDLIIMPKNATMMIHDPFAMTIGNADDMRKMAEALDTIKLGIIAAYRDKTGLSDEKISQLMTDETWMSAKDAVGYGFADEIDEPVKIAASFDLSIFAKEIPKFQNFTHNSTVDPNEPAWGSVDKTKLPRVAFAEQGENDKKSTWGYPHHWIKGGSKLDDNGIYTDGTMYLSRSGLAAAWQRANQSGNTITAEAKSHLQSHRKDIGMGDQMKESNIKKEVRQMSKETLKCTACGGDMVEDKCPRCEMKASTENASKQARQAELDRAKALRAIGKEYKAETLAEHAILEGWTEDNLRNAILKRIKEASPGSGPIMTVEAAHGGKPFRNFGEQLIAVVNSGRTGKADKRLLEVYDAASGAGEAIPSDGGFLVQSDFTTELLARANQTQVLAPKCYHIPVSGNGLEAPIVDETSRATGSRWGGVRVYRAAEATAATKAKPKFAKLEMRLEKIIGLFYSTDELLADATALEAIVMRAFTEEFAFKIDDEIINGTGSGEMLGIMNCNALVTQAKVGSQSPATVVSGNIMSMYARMPARLVPGAEWYINQEIWPQLFSLSILIGTTGGVPLFMPPGGISTAPYGTLFGRPIVPIEQAAALGTIGDIIFANLNQYAIIEKGGLNAAQSIHVQFLQDENTFRWTARNNGQPIWKSAITPYKGSATQSPFIVIETRS